MPIKSGADEFVDVSFDRSQTLGANILSGDLLDRSRILPKLEEEDEYYPDDPSRRLLSTTMPK